MFGNVVVTLLLVGMVGFAIYCIVKNKKNGKCSCGGNCSSCNGCSGKKYKNEDSI